MSLRLNGMRVLCALLVLAAACSGCRHADPADVDRAAGEIMARVEARRYDEVYDAASSDLRASVTREQFVAKMRALEGFGQMLKHEPASPPAVERRTGGSFAVAPFKVEYALGDGAFELTLRANDATGVWQLESTTYDVSAATYDPPYAPDAGGAEKLARRFLYLWQNRRYDDLAATMDLHQNPDKLRDFLERLESAGTLMTLARTSFRPAGAPGNRVATADYDVTFDKGKGRVTFKLDEASGEWRVENVTYSVEYAATPGATS